MKNTILILLLTLINYFTVLSQSKGHSEVFSITYGKDECESSIIVGMFYIKDTIPIYTAITLKNGLPVSPETKDVVDYNNDPSEGIYEYLINDTKESLLHILINIDPEDGDGKAWITELNKKGNKPNKKILINDDLIKKHYPNYSFSESLEVDCQISK